MKVLGAGKEIQHIAAKGRGKINLWLSPERC
jgi:hypothetical protein